MEGEKHLRQASAVSPLEASPQSEVGSGEVSRGEKMLYSGTDPESYITEYTLVYEEKQWQTLTVQQRHQPSALIISLFVCGHQKRQPHYRARATTRERWGTQFKTQVLYKWPSVQ